MPLILSLNTQYAPLALVGGKGMNLTRLVCAGFSVPPGFIVTTDAYESFVQDHGLSEPILSAVRNASPDDPDALQAASQTIRAWFGNHTLPANLVVMLSEAYAHLGCPSVAVRSSATTEDLPGFSFAGQQENILKWRCEIWDVRCGIRIAQSAWRVARRFRAWSMEQTQIS